MESAESLIQRNAPVVHSVCREIAEQARAGEFYEDGTHPLWNVEYEHLQATDIYRLLKDSETLELAVEDEVSFMLELI
jgi:hypothetical protein